MFAAIVIACSLNGGLVTCEETTIQVEYVSKATCGRAMVRALSIVQDRRPAIGLDYVCKYIGKPA